MSKLINWLSERRLLTIILVAAYFVPNVLCHDLVQNLSVKIEGMLSLPVYEIALSSLGIVTLAILSWLTFLKLKDGPRKLLKATYWSLTVVLVVVSSNTIMAKDIEMVHFPQYAILTLPFFALTRRFGETAAWVTLLGAVDEGYQYLVLHRGWVGIYDFGDVVLNLIGAGIGVVLILSLVHVNPASNPVSSYSFRNLIKSPALLITAGLIICGILLYVTGVMQLYPGEKASPARIYLNRGAAPAQFWLRPATLRKTFHIVSPGEGILLVVILLAVYVIMDFKVELKYRERSSVVDVLSSKNQ